MPETNGQPCPPFFTLHLSFSPSEPSFFTLYPFPECVVKGSRLTWESEGRAVFARRCFRVRNRPQLSATVRMMSLWPCHWGKLLQVTFHGCVTCQFAPLLHCDLHESDMSRKKRDTFRCTGTGFSVMRLAFGESCFWGVGCGRAIGVCVSGCGIEALLS